MMYFVQKEIQNDENYKDNEHHQEVKTFFDLKNNVLNFEGILFEFLGFH